jgi:iron complex transport system substrate-binding protein
MKTNPVWASLEAVENDKVFVLPVGGFIWNRPSCESAVLLPLWLAQKAYPDKFKDISIEQEVKRYWKEIIGFELSNEDVKNILYPPPNPLYAPGGQQQKPGN